MRWLKIHHPELLLPKSPQPAPEAPKPETVPTEQGPKTESQKQPVATPPKRIAAKVTPLPKPLRNPKNHPELLAEDGARGLTHLRVDRRAGVADGTTSFGLT